MNMMECVMGVEIMSAIDESIKFLEIGCPRCGLKTKPGLLRGNFAEFCCACGYEWEEKGEVLDMKIWERCESGSSCEDTDLCPCKHFKEVGKYERTVKAKRLKCKNHKKCWDWNKKDRDLDHLMNCPCPFEEYEQPPLAHAVLLGGAENLSRGKEGE